MKLQTDRNLILIDGGRSKTPYFRPPQEVVKAVRDSGQIARLRVEHTDNQSDENVHDITFRLYLDLVPGKDKGQFIYSNQRNGFYLKIPEELRRMARGMMIRAQYTIRKGQAPFAIVRFDVVVMSAIKPQSVPAN